MNIADIFGVMAGFAWLGFFLMLGLLVMRASRNQPNRGVSTVVVVLLVAAIALSTVGAGLVFVEPDELGVVITAVGGGGIRNEALTPGLHWVIPFFERVERYSILRQTYTMSSVSSEGQIQGDDAIQVRTKDGQQVLIDASVIYSIDPNKSVDLYKTWRNAYEDGLVRPTSRGIIRDAASQLGVEEIVSTKRAEMEQTITDALAKTLSENNLILQDFILRDIRFSDEYANAVEQKQIAEQQAQQAKFVVESKKQEAEQARQVAQGAADAAVIAAKGEAEARVIAAEAEAKSLQLIADVLAKNPNLLQYQYINKLSPNVQVMFLPSDAPFILPLPGSNNSITIPQ